MGMYRFKPPMSGRMGTLYTLASIKDAVLVEYGCMGHMMYGRVFLTQAGVTDGCQLYSTHIDETDISLGSTARLERVVAEVVQKENPRAIFLLPSSVPTIIGTDLQAIAYEMQDSYPTIPILPFGYGGFDIEGNRGVQEALHLLVQKLPQKREKTEKPTFNIIGSCADLFRFQEDSAEIVRLMKGAFDMEVLCTLTSNTTVGQIEDMSGAHINLVIRREGEKAAKRLQKDFATPYYVGRPYGVEGTTKFLEAIGEILNVVPSQAFIKTEIAEATRQIDPTLMMFRHMIHSHSDEIALSAGGHADVVSGIRAFGCGEFHLPAGDFWCDCSTMSSEEIPYYSEKEWSETVKEKDGLLMASGEVLAWAHKSKDLQIANPDSRWRVNPYGAPFVGFRGAVHLVDLWLNTALEQEESNKK
ncbi:nitrogenase component 1 [Scatolibacter rhodanostii]|uniref:nitrogenase component 1 n=1 Tax=Scatolibacter rhodanostii TaxID=2014781 RepID=UPI000C07CF27|nr:nitrogenase component 1 [Scatolibacter rhodanostii]